MQKKLEKSGMLLDRNGNLNDYGWSERPILRYDRSLVRVPRYRIKEWDYYLILGSEYGVAFTIASLGYMNQLTVNVIDLRNKRAITETLMEWLPRIHAGMSACTEDSVAAYAYRGLALRFERTGQKRILTVDYPRFDRGKGLAGTVELTQEAGDESIVQVSPFAGKRQFSLNEKILTMPARGAFTYGSEKLTFLAGAAFGTLEWGRGVWPYQNNWYWGGGAGYVRGKRFGFNIGYSFGSNDHFTENALFLDGKLHKLEQVTFHFNRADHLSPWRFTSNDGRFEMDFVPILDRAAKRSIIILKTDQHQVFGRFSGTVVLDNGTKLEVTDILGFAEDFFMRY